jgi:membrane-associated phospholipid phosphatase
VLRALDRALLRALRTRGHSPGAERVVLAFTRAGEHGILWQALCLAGIALDGRRRGAYVRTMRTVLIAYLANIGLKYLVRRPRPRLESLPALSSTVTSLSFPSAHSTTSFAAARSLAAEGVVSPLAVYPLAVAMAASRVYVGVHYPSDVVAGATLGTAASVLLRS